MDDYQDYQLKDLDPQGAEDLIVAIVKQAVTDWKSAKKVLAKHPDSIMASNSQIDCERFFLSPYFCALTGTDGKHILSKLEEDYEHERKR